MYLYSCELKSFLELNRSFRCWRICLKNSFVSELLFEVLNFVKESSRVCSFNRCLIFKVRSALRFSRNIVNYITSFWLCQHLFSTFLNFFQFVFSCAALSRVLCYINIMFRHCQHLFTNFFGVFNILLNLPINQNFSQRVLYILMVSVIILYIYYIIYVSVFGR